MFNARSEASIKAGVTSILELASEESEASQQRWVYIISPIQVLFKITLVLWNQESYLPWVTDALNLFPYFGTIEPRIQFTFMVKESAFSLFTLVLQNPEFSLSTLMLKDPA